MPTTIVTTDNFAAGVLYAPVAGDTLIIAAGVSVGSTDAPTIDMQGGARLQVFGMVYQNEGHNAERAVRRPTPVSASWRAVVWLRVATTLRRFFRQAAC